MKSVMKSSKTWKEWCCIEGRKWKYLEVAECLKKAKVDIQTNWSKVAIEIFL